MASGLGLGPPLIGVALDLALLLLGVALGLEVGVVREVADDLFGLAPALLEGAHQLAFAFCSCATGDGILMLGLDLGAQRLELLGQR